MASVAVWGLEFLAFRGWTGSLLLRCLRSNLRNNTVTHTDTQSPISRPPIAHHLCPYTWLQSMYGLILSCQNFCQPQQIVFCTKLIQQSHTQTLFDLPLLNAGHGTQGRKASCARQQGTAYIESELRPFRALSYPVRDMH